MNAPRDKYRDKYRETKRYATKKRIDILRPRGGNVNGSGSNGRPSVCNRLSTATEDDEDGDVDDD